MDKRQLITKIEPTATGEEVAWNEDQSGNVVTGWMPVSDAKEIARRWNAYPELVEAVERMTDAFDADNDASDGQKVRALEDARAILATLNTNHQ